MRLIDADGLIDEICREECERKYEDCDYHACLHVKPVVNAPTIGEWISVKDRLPEDEGDVLVYGVSPRGRKKMAIMNYLAFEADRPRWALDGIWTVLYWMPFPEPPEAPNDH